MLYREYGRTGKKISLVSFGGMQFQDVDNREKSSDMLVEAAKAGVNYFDTAPAYFGTRSEEVFGLGFQKLKKLGLPFYCATKTSKSDEKSIREELEQQLERLCVDCIDFYHVWCITSLENWEQRKKNGVLKTFAKLKDEGLIGHVCVSSHLMGDQIRTLLKEDIFEGVLFGYSACNFAFREEVFQAITERKLGCVIMNPLGGGIIPRNPGIFDFIRTQENETVVEAALRFLFAHSDITSALVGFGNTGHIQEALKALEGYKEISPKEMQRMKAGIKDSFKDLCTGCRYCDHCPEGIRIPQLMNAYDQKTLYGNDQATLNQLKWHWNIPIEEANQCIECGACEDLCTQHLAIIDRLKEMVEMGQGRK